MSLLVYFNDRIVDLAPDTVLAYTYNGIKPGDLAGREVPYTNKLVGVFSDSNDITFGIARDSKVNPEQPYIKNNCKVVQNGYEIIASGKAVIQKTFTGYEFVVYSDIAVLTDALGSKTIDELRWLENDEDIINWTAAEIDSRRFATEGVMAPVVNYGQMNLIQTLLNPGFEDGGGSLNEWEAVDAFTGNFSFPAIRNVDWYVDTGRASVDLTTYYSATQGGQRGWSKVLRQKYKFAAGQDYDITLDVRHIMNSAGNQPSSVYVRLYTEDGIGYDDFHVANTTTSFVDEVISITPTKEYFYFGFRFEMYYDGPDATTESYPQCAGIQIASSIKIGDVYLPSVSYLDIIRSIFSNNEYVASTLDGIGNISKLMIPFSKDSLMYTGFFNECREFDVTINPITIVADGVIKFDNIIKKDLYGYYDPTTGVYSQANDYQFIVDPATDGRDFYAHYFASLSVKANGTATIAIRKAGGGILASLNIVGGAITTFALVVTTDEGQSDNEGFIMSGGETIEVHCNLNTATSVQIISGRFNNKVIGKNFGTNPKFYGQEILPKIKQVDFLKDALVRYGVVLKEKNKALSAKTIDQIINDKTQFIDWTSKRVNKPDEIVYSEFEYAQQNDFIYPELDKFFKSDIFNRTLVVDNKNLPAQKTIYESIFGGSADLTVGDDSFHMTPAYIPLWDKPPLLYPRKSENAFNNGGLRILIRRDKGSSETYVKYNNNSRLDYKVGSFSEPGAPFMGWGGFVDQNMSALERSIRRNKTLYRYYMLTTEDVYNVDQHKLMFDDGEWFIIENFSNWVEGIEVKAKLFKVN